MFILGFLPFASRNITEINLGYKQQTDMYELTYFNLFCLFYCSEYVVILVKFYVFSYPSSSYFLTLPRILKLSFLLITNK